MFGAIVTQFDARRFVDRGVGGGVQRFGLPVLPTSLLFRVSEATDLVSWRWSTLNKDVLDEGGGSTCDGSWGTRLRRNLRWIIPLGMTIAGAYGAFEIGGVEMIGNLAANIASSAALAAVAGGTTALALP